MSQSDWENSFVDLNKNLFSADAVKGYDVYESIKDIITPESRVLDFGCGKGNLVSNLRERGFVNSYGVDPSDLLLKSSVTNQLYPGSLLKLEGSKLPFEDGIFDVVYSSGVLHHIEWKDYEGVFKEIRRVLKKDGYFIYLEPRESICRTLGHIFVFSPAKYLIKQVRTLEQCLKAEWPTYRVWLDNEIEAQGLICRSNFRLERNSKKLLTSIVRFKAI